MRQGLSLPLRPGYPMVLNHDDFLERNIHVDGKTGHITGIVDWADARVSPVGLSLWGVGDPAGRADFLDTSTPVMGVSGRDFGSLFTAWWEICGRMAGGRAIAVARMFGLFRSYGFDRAPEEDDAVPVGDGDSDFVCLEALRLR